MRKVAMITMVGCPLSFGLAYALNESLWGMLACLLAGALWCYPSPYRAELRSTLGLFILAGLGCIGLGLGHSHLWSLANFVLLLVAWDLDHYTRVFQEFEKDQTRGKTSSALFYAHLKRLGILAVVGWCLGIVALNIRIQISFGVALILISLMIFGLRQVARDLPEG